jgi:DNA-binding CsgD family transcriptional regulator
MTSLAAQKGEPAAASNLATRSDLSDFLGRVCRSVGADSYMLVTILHDQDRSDVRIIASNWIYDTIQAIGQSLIAVIAQSPSSTSAGIRPRPIRANQALSAPSILTCEQAHLLDRNGHGELCCLRLNVGRSRVFLLLSARLPDQIDLQAAWRSQLQCSYALSQTPQLLATTVHQDPLSDRERECLFWVSEGKTTDEVAVILGVSSNTVNSYITHAIQKFAASNRAMAIATAIRNGII